MKFYEEEVVSIPASWGMDGILKYGVYSCPLKERYKYRPSLYVAFRPQGGVVRTLYKIRNVYEMMPDVAMISNRDMDDQDRKRIIRYLNDPKFSVVKRDSYTTQFFVLDMKHVIQLPQGGAASSGRSPRGIAYYYLADMLNPIKCKLLKTASKCRAGK